MAVQAYARIREAIRRRLNDPAPGTFWTEDELDSHIATGIREWCERTKCLRAQSTVWSQATRDTYNMPPDFLELLRMEDEEGSELTITDFRALAEEFGTDFTATTGTPTHVYADLDGQGKFRLYPRPTASIDVAAVEMGGYFLPQMNVAVGGPVFATSRYVYAVDTTYVYRFSHDLTLTRKTAHGVAGLTSVTDIVATDNVTTTYVVPDTVFFCSGAAMYKMGPADTSATLFGTSAGDITRLFPPDRSTARYLLYHTTANGKYTPTAAYSEAALFGGGATVIYQLACPYGTGLAWAACGTDGIHKITLASPGSSTVALAGTYYGVVPISVESDGSAHMVAASSTAVGTLVYSALYTTLTFTAYTSDSVCSSYTSPIVTDGHYVWAYGRLLADYLLVQFEGDSVAASWSGVTPPNSNCAVAGTAVLWYSGLRWYYTDREAGELVYLDGVTFTQDEGIVVDVEDDADATLFLMDSDEGAVIQWIEDTAAYTLQYVRGPHEDEQPLASTTGIEAFAVWQCLMNEDDRQNLAKADMHRQLYERELARALRQSDRGYLAGTTVRPRAYYF